MFNIIITNKTIKDIVMKIVYIIFGNINFVDLIINHQLFYNFHKSLMLG